MISRADLDKRICDVVEGAGNTESYREFIRTTEMEFGLGERDLDMCTEEQLNAYLEFLDDLWNK